MKGRSRRLDEKEAMMKFSNYLTWFRRLLILGAVVAGATASAAGAVGGPDIRHNAAARLTAPDVLERYAAAHPYGTAATPDVLERYAKAHPFGGPTPDVLERFAATHPYGVGLSSITLPAVSGVSSDAITRHFDHEDIVYGNNPSAVSDQMTRHFDHEDALFGNTPVASALPDIATSRGGFDWGDWAIGIGTGLGLALLLGVGLVMSRQLRQRTLTA